jgi:NAD(P)H-hydrate epimerase
MYVLDRDSVRAVDRAAINEYGIPGIVLMENAARALADEALAMMPESAGLVVIVCGSGNNGGDGWALARHLHNAGSGVRIAPLGEPRAGGDAAVNCRICRNMKLREIIPADLPAHLAVCDLVVDAIFGTGLDRPVTGVAASTIESINHSGRPVLAVDVPSGLDCDTGQPLGSTIRAARTVTFVARKPAMNVEAAAAYTGAVVVADIGVPGELLERFGRPVDILDEPTE